MTDHHGLAERVYRALLRLYPGEFLDRFGDDMVQLFNDKLRDASAGTSRGGVAGAWRRMLVDVAATAPSERLRRNRRVAHSMSSKPPMKARLLGLAGVIGGAALLSAFLIDVPSGPNALRIAVFNLGAIAVVVAVLRREGASHSMIMVLAGGVAIMTNAVYAFLALADIHAAMSILSGAALWLTTAMVGAAIARLGGLTRWGALALVAGSALALTGIDRLGLVSATSPTVFNALSQFGIVTVAIGWIVISLDIATLRRPLPATG